MGRVPREAEIRMMFECQAAMLESADIPPFWSPFIAHTDGGLTITGDRTVYRDIYMHCSDDRLILSTDITELGTRLTSLGTGLTMSNLGLSSLLHNAMVPIPHTLYDEIQILSIGDTARVTRRAESLSVSLDYSFPWMLDMSRQDSVADEAKLFELLTASTVRQLEEHGDSGFLMMSSGMDSPSIALALAEAGRTDIPCVTYRSGPEDPEPPLAAEICQRLGLEHQIVDVPTDEGVVAETMVNFFTKSPLPGVDLSQIPYIFATAAVSNPSGAILDGGGNDNYMNYPGSGGSRRKQRYRIRGKPIASAVRRLAPVDSPLNYLARSRAEATMPGRNLRMQHVRRLRPDPVDMSDWWYEVSRTVSDLDRDEMLHVVLRRQIHATQVLLKQKLAATAIGLGASLPWCDDDLVDYYFNLPHEDRFDFDNNKNKMLLRKMLLRYLDYDADAVGKHYFLFDGATFLQRNMGFVRAEIDASPLWASDGLPMVHKWLDQLDRRPMLHHALLTIFMISGWSNHSPLAHAATGRLPAG